MAPHSSNLAWEIPRMEEPGRLKSTGSQRVRDDWAPSLSIFTFMHWRWKWPPTPVFLPGESQGRGSLVGCHLWGRTELDTTERLHFHFSLSCIGDGNGNLLQCSCLENPRDGGAWWAAVYGVPQSRTRLTRLSSSSSSRIISYTNSYLVTKYSPSKRKESITHIAVSDFYPWGGWKSQNKHKKNIHFSSSSLRIYYPKRPMV